MCVLRVCHTLLLLLAPGAAAAAELKDETVAAYEAYIEVLERRFAPEMQGSFSIEHAAEETRQRLRAGEILGWPGQEDGILDAPDGLIHHWRGAAFVPDATLEAVLAVVQDYPSYAATYDWVIRSTLIGRERRPERRQDHFRVLLRIERSARMVTSVVDVWTVVEYRYPGRGRAVGTSRSDCVRQVENAGRPGERRLTAGRGSGYLWRANTFATYLHRDDGVYVDLHNVGLSRGFPPLLGWLIEPIARRLGRGSVTETLRQLRDAVAVRDERPPAAAQPPTARSGDTWCGE